MNPDKVYIVRRTDIFSLGEEVYKFKNEKKALHFMYLMNTLGDKGAKYELSAEAK